MTEPRITKINVEAVRRWVYDVRNNRGGWHDHAVYPTIAAACDRWQKAETPEAKVLEEKTIIQALVTVENLPAEFKPRADG